MTYTAIVSGGTKGIGRYITEILHQEGFNVLPLFKGDVATAEKFTKDTSIFTYRCDITDEMAVIRLTSYLNQVRATPEVLVNNAGYNSDGLLWKLNIDQWQEVVDTILKGTFLLTRAVVPFMREQKNGSIINISSVVGQMGVAGTTNYAAAKAGLNGFTKSLAKELAPKNIVVNTIALGYFDTGIISTVPEDHLKKIVDTVPMKRLGNYWDLIDIIRFLSKTTFCTGQIINLNGGLY